MSIVKKGNMQGKMKRKRFLCFLLMIISIPFVLTACTGGSGAENGTGTSGNAGAGSKDAAGTDLAVANDENAAGASANTIMGRYVEEEIDLSDLLSMPNGIYKRDDGALVIPDSNVGIFVSEDQGATWEAETPEWFIGMLEENCYISEMDMLPDGTFAVTYDANADDDYQPAMELIWPDGTRVPVEIPLAYEEDYIRQMEVSDEGRLFALTRGKAIYEVDKDGSSKQILELSDYIQAFYVREDLIFMDIADLSGMPMVYDMKSETYTDDNVLTDFVDENYKDRSYNGSWDRQMYLLPAQEEAVYLIGDQGIHRHVIGGNMIEQVVDGKLSMLNNPSYWIISAIMPDEETFLVLFTGSKLIRYTYDPDIPAVPEKMLKVYSLREDDTIRQVISYYQSRHTDVFVSYEVGMEEGSAVTREDAIKKLNTQIMAGNGPDLLLMDDMPLDSYIKKGMLLDITDFLAACSAEDALFDNIIDALKVDNKAYVAPATFSIPMIVGEETYTQNMTDLSDLAKSVEALRAAHPGDDIIGICSAKDVLQRFVSVSAPEWLAADGSLNRETIGEYLEQCKRIYDAQMEGIREEIVEDYGDDRSAYRAGATAGAWGINWQIADDIFSYIDNGTYLLSGWLDTSYGYQEVTSIERVKGFENSTRTAMTGQCTRVFQPQSLLGISAASAQIDEAKDFMRFFLSAEAASGYYRFPINQAAYDAQFTPIEEYLGEDDQYGTLTLVSEDGLFIAFNIYWPSDELIAELKEEIAAVSTPYMPSSVLENAVYTEGSIYMEGYQTLEDALEEIEKSVAIYMAE